MTRPKGADKLAARFRQLASPDMRKRVGAALFVAGNMIEVEAAISISTGSVSGKNHKPSRPGEAPKFDTGTLTSNIETVQESVLEVVVSSNAPYSAALERGTSRMAARPFMGPAANKVRREAQQLIGEAMRRELRKAPR